MMMNKYETIIYWSEADEVYIAEMPELKGCISHGDSPDEALKNIQALAQEWLELAKEKKWQIPAPKGRLIFA
jgi:predicted RNase H-like HicB family nuclease